MAPVPPNTALRVRVTYNGPRGEHRMIFYGRTGVVSGLVINQVRSVVTELANLQYANTIWTSAEVSQPGSNFFTPIGWDPIEAPAQNPAPTASDPSAKYVGFVARSVTTGVRRRLFVFNTPVVFEVDLRRTSAESSAVAAVVAELNASTDLGAIDGTAVVWKAYGNQGLHDYWVRRDRIAGNNF